MIDAIRRWDVVDWVFFLSISFLLGVVGYGIYKDTREYHITCYSPDLSVTYMSIEPVRLPNEYGVWKFSNGKGAYVQQSGDTCVVQDVVEIPTTDIGTAEPQK